MICEPQRRGRQQNFPKPKGALLIRDAEVESYPARRVHRSHGACRLSRRNFARTSILFLEQFHVCTVPNILCRQKYTSAEPWIIDGQLITPRPPRSYTERGLSGVIQ